MKRPQSISSTAHAEFTSSAEQLKFWGNGAQGLQKRLRIYTLNVNLRKRFCSFDNPNLKRSDRLPVDRGASALWLYAGPAVKCSLQLREFQVLQANLELAKNDVCLHLLLFRLAVYYCFAIFFS